MQRILTVAAADFACGTNYTFYAVAITDAGESPVSAPVSGYESPACQGCGVCSAALHLAVYVCIHAWCGIQRGCTVGCLVGRQLNIAPFYVLQSPWGPRHLLCGCHI